MKNNLETAVKSLHSNIEAIFKDVKNDSFSSNTIDALSGLYDTMCELNLEKNSFSTPDGIIGVTENGVGFHLHDSNENYHYCAECREITKHTIKQSSKTIQIS
jgi:hypothetical protein